MNMLTPDSQNKVQEMRNLAVAFGLILLILTLWQMFYERPRQEAILAEQQAKMEMEELQKPKEVKPESIPTALPTAIPRNQALAETATSRVKIDSPRLAGSISLKGLRFDDLVLKDYNKTLEPNSDNVTLLSPVNTESIYFANFGWISSAGEKSVPGSDAVWQASQTTLTPASPVTLSWDNGAGQKFFVTIGLDQNYMFTIKQSVENYGANAVNISTYGRVNRNWAEHKTFYILHEGPLGVFDDTLEEIDYSDLEDEKFAFENARGWLGITDKYWLTAMVPSSEVPFNANVTSYVGDNDVRRYQTDFYTEAETVAPGASKEITHRLFAGAKEVQLLDHYQDTFNIHLFDRAVDFGWLYFLTKPFFYALAYLKVLLGEFGLAILAFTVVIKLILFPIANKSYKAMSRMRRLHPELMELKEKYKDDRMEFQKQMMEFYKEKKVNPAAGCLPMLVQIPVFFALYKVLFVTIEMRHTPFYGWVKDLSAKDPTNVFQLFGLVQWDVPAILPHLGAWPLMMMVTMIIQMRLNPPPQDPTQAMIMKVMPFAMVFLFAQFPAGLVIYWTWNNTLSIIQQVVINRNVARAEARA